MRNSKRKCPLCSLAGRNSDRLLSKCKYLPDEDKKFLSLASNVDIDEAESASDNDDDSQESDNTYVRHIKSTPNVKKSGSISLTIS